MYSHISFAEIMYSIVQYTMLSPVTSQKSAKFCVALFVGPRPKLTSRMDPTKLHMFCSYIPSTNTPKSLKIKSRGGPSVNQKWGIPQKLQFDGGHRRTQ